MKVPEKFFRNNSASTLNLIEQMMAAGVNKLIFSSTAALYGEPEQTPIKETDTLKGAFKTTSPITFTIQGSAAQGSVAQYVV